jgi:hypothetical protein
MILNGIIAINIIIIITTTTTTITNISITCSTTTTTILLLLYYYYYYYYYYYHYYFRLMSLHNRLYMLIFSAFHTKFHHLTPKLLLLFLSTLSHYLYMFINLLLFAVFLNPFFFSGPPPTLTIIRTFLILICNFRNKYLENKTNWKM